MPAKNIDQDKLHTILLTLVPILQDKADDKDKQFFASLAKLLRHQQVLSNFDFLLLTSYLLIGSEYFEMKDLQEHDLGIDGKGFSKAIPKIIDSKFLKVGSCKKLADKKKINRKFCFQ